MRQKYLKSFGERSRVQKEMIWLLLQGMKCKTRGISITESATALLMRKTPGSCTSPACTNYSLSFSYRRHSEKQNTHNNHQPMPQPQNSDIQGQLLPLISTAERGAINSICQQGEMPNKRKKVQSKTLKMRNKIKQNKAALPRTHTSSAAKEGKDTAPGKRKQDEGSIRDSK